MHPIPRRAAVLATVLSAACGPGAPPPPPRDAIPDPAREVLVATLWPRLRPAERAALRDSLRVVTTRSHVVPALVYHWGRYVAPGRPSAAYDAVAATAGGRPLPVRNPHEWSHAVGRVGWAPANVRQAVIACAEASRAAGAHPGHRNALYLGRAMPGGWVASDPTAQRRLQPPKGGTRGHGQWSALVWMGEPGRAIRYRCLFAPRVGRRGPLAEFQRTDSIGGMGIAAPP